ncbi:type III-B CRISPR module RAMP protein Cmr6 [Thermocrinis minervae]|nr:type III-B CRISPR module RAMP protein Cmr6 [Thermocrinis minervae]
MRKFTLKAGYRLAIGLGNPSFIENGFAFYPTYGIPYIPGSSLKGITRNLFILIVSEHLNRDAKSVEEDLMNEKFDNSKVPLYLFEDNFGEWELQETFNVLFGTKNREGKVIFFDAFPKSLTLDDIEIDIMNPHYQPYYTNPKEKPPIDCYNPVPIHYMVLKEGVEFEFVLGVANDTDPRYLELAERLLKAVLKSFGVGAKRRKGYGWFIEEANR